MRVRTVVALLSLAAAGAYGSSGLLDVLGLETDTIIAMAGIDLPSMDGTSEDDPPPCGVSPSKAMVDTIAMCKEEAMGGGKGKGRRRRMNANVLQKCVFEKLSLVDKEGTPIQAEIEKLIDAYAGDDQGKQIMKRMTEKCSEATSMTPANKKANVMVTCVQKGMRDTCKVYDLKKENPSLAMMVAQKSAEKCMEGIELPPKMLMSRVRCAAKELTKFADARHAALAPARKRRSPKKDKKDKDEKDKSEEREDESKEKKEKKPKGKQEKDSKEEDESKEKGSKDDRSERRRKLKERRKEMQQQDVQEARERLEKVVGPLEGVIQAAGDALLETDRCTYAAVGVLDADNNVDSDEMKTLLSEATGTPMVKATLLAAAETCHAKDAAYAAFIECINNELTVACPSVLSTDRRQKKANRRAERGRKRQAARAGRPANVAKPKMPAALKRRS